MNKKIISNVLEIKTIGETEYEIAYINIIDFTYVKRIDKRVVHPDVMGMGHIVSNSLWMEENDDLYYATTPHNEFKSSGVGTNKLVADTTDDEFKSCQTIINDFYPLIANGMFSQEATKVFNEIMKKVNELEEKKFLNK